VQLNSVAVFLDGRAKLIENSVIFNAKNWLGTKCWIVSSGFCNLNQKSMVGNGLLGWRRNMCR
jgi:hypothetical protein